LTYARAGNSNSNLAAGAGASAGGSGAVGGATDFRNFGATALGVGAQAGSTAAGQTNATAVGNGAMANAMNATALGQGSSANHQNAAAFGAGAATSRDNQQTFGTGTNTYTMTGVTSAASKTAQGAPTQLVTSNNNGDLAAYTAADLGLLTNADLSGLQNGLSNLQAQIGSLNKRDNELAEGIAISLALAQPIFHTGQTFAVNVGWGGFGGENAVGVTGAGIVDQGGFGKGSTVTLYGGVGAGASQGTVAGKGGVSFGW
jgi:hypothetical protein